MREKKIQKNEKLAELHSCRKLLDDQVNGRQTANVSRKENCYVHKYLEGMYKSRQHLKT